MYWKEAWTEKLFSKTRFSAHSWQFPSNFQYTLLTKRDRFSKRPALFQALIATALCILIIVIYHTIFGLHLPLHDFNTYTQKAFRSMSEASFKPLANSYTLNEAQCDAAFPGLFDDIHESVAHRTNAHITPHDLDVEGDNKSLTRVMIYDGDLYVLADGNVAPDERTYSSLHGLHRALVADPERSTIPNIEFILNREDICPAESSAWCFTRRRQDVRNWMMPDFGHWAWPISTLGGYNAVRRKMLIVEANYASFSAKIPKALWRGNLDVGREPREHLLAAAKGKDWSSIETLDWSHGNPTNLMPIEDHCRWQYIAHAEGVSYSGRHKYVQNCESVIVSPDLVWIQPFHRLMLGEGPDQNYMHVANDYSDLDAKMQHYLERPDEAARIAKNSVRVFRDRYLTPAAEACYWRKLIRGYGSVAFKPDFYQKDEINGTQPLHETERRWRGTSWESYVVRGSLDSEERRFFQPSGE